ncbi:MAG: GWxTD domain-containing protein [Candidatus Aminicenantes bacterium]|nr:GWxTD domain-containing protein [Candidatus Aminicenantes bacterium]
MKKAVFLLLPLSALWLASCASYKLERSLDPDSRDFLSKVRYVITKQERKTFLNLPLAERKPFTEEFWKKRDPTPDTDVNEFKDEYFKRIDEANHLFTEGSPGWLQDRGRIYILLGPPWNRETYPRGITFYGQPTEIWYYGYFPIVFVDEAWNGDYKLDPQSAIQLAEIMSVQMYLKPAILTEKGALDCKLELQRQADGKALVRVSVPLKKIWLKSEGQNLLTSLEATIEMLSSSEKRLWAEQKSYALSFTEEQLEKIIKEDYVIEIPVDLKPEYALLNLTLKNTTDGSKAFKRIKLS